MSLFSPPHSSPSSISTLDLASTILRHSELHRDLHLYRLFPNSPLARCVLRAHDTTLQLGADHVRILSSALNDLQTAVASAESRHNELRAASFELEYRAALARLVWPDAKPAGGTMEIPALPAEAHGLQKQLIKEKEEADMAMKKCKIKLRRADEECRLKENVIWHMMEQLRIWETERWQMEIVGRIQEYVRWENEAKMKEEQRMEGEKKLAKERLNVWKIQQDQKAKEKKAKEAAKKKLDDSRIEAEQEAERKAEESLRSEKETEKQKKEEERLQRMREYQEKLDSGDPAALQRQRIQKLVNQFKGGLREGFDTEQIQECYRDFQEEQEKAVELGPYAEALWTRAEKIMKDAHEMERDMAATLGDFEKVRMLKQLAEWMFRVDRSYQRERMTRRRRNLRGDTYDDSLPDEAFKLPDRQEAIVKDGVALPLLASQKAAIDGWLASRTQAFQDRASISAATFPEPPTAPCYRKACLTRSDERNLEACECTVRNLFRICFQDGKGIKKERLQWHPDRFSTCHSEEIDRKAQEMFNAATQVLDALETQATLEQRYGPIAEWRTTKEWASEVAWRERKLARRKERMARQEARKAEGADPYLSDSGDDGSDRDKWIPKKTGKPARAREAAAKQRGENQETASTPEANPESSQGARSPPGSEPQPRSQPEHNASAEPRHQSNPDAESKSEPEPKPKPDTGSEAGQMPCSEQEADPRNAHHSWALILRPASHEHTAVGRESSPSGMKDDAGDPTSSADDRLLILATDDLYDATDDGQDSTTEQ